MSPERELAVVFAAAVILASVTPGVWMANAVMFGDLYGGIVAGLFAIAVLIATIDRLE